MSVHTKLIVPKFAPGQSLNGMMMYRLFKEKPIYLSPSKILLDKLASSKKTKFEYPAMDDSDSDIDNEVLSTPAFHCNSDSGQTDTASSDLSRESLPIGRNESIQSSREVSSEFQNDLLNANGNNGITLHNEPTNVSQQPIIDLTEEYNALLNESFLMRIVT